MDVDEDYDDGGGHDDATFFDYPGKRRQVHEAPGSVRFQTVPTHRNRTAAGSIPNNRFRRFRLLPVPNKGTFGRSTQINSGACRGLLDEVPKLIRVPVGNFWSPQGSRTPVHRGIYNFAKDFDTNGCGPI